jgi:hypothetical protein
MCACVSSRIGVMPGGGNISLHFTSCSCCICVVHVGVRICDLFRTKLLRSGGYTGRETVPVSAALSPWFQLLLAEPRGLGRRFSIIIACIRRRECRLHTNTRVRVLHRVILCPWFENSAVPTHKLLSYASLGPAIPLHVTSGPASFFKPALGSPISTPTMADPANLAVWWSPANLAVWCSPGS